jgi:hypothetical protein
MHVTAQSSLRKLQTEVQTSLIEMQRQVWKARGHAKQKWLGRLLAEPVENPRDAEQRASWIKRALNVVKCGQDEIKYQSALLDAYAEHLSVLEMSLMAASESKHVSGGGETEQRATTSGVTHVDEAETGKREKLEAPSRRPSR